MLMIDIDMYHSLSKFCRINASSHRRIVRFITYFPLHLLFGAISVMLYFC